MAAINFPNPGTQTPSNTFSPVSSPSKTLNGLTYVWNGIGWRIKTTSSSPGGGASVTIGETAPGDSSHGDLWWDSGAPTSLFIYYTDSDSSQWVPATPQTDSWYINGGQIVPSQSNQSVNIGTGTLTAGSATFSGPVNSGDPDITDADAEGSRFGISGTVTSKKDVNTSGEYFRGYKGTLKTFNVNNLGFLNLGTDVTAVTTTLITLDGSTGTTTIDQFHQCRGIIIRAGDGTYSDDRTFRAAATGSSNSAVYIGNEKIDTTLPSDRRTKENIVPTTVDASKIVKDLEVVDFNFIGSSSLFSADDTIKRIGFIAQDVESVFPQMVSTPKNAEDLYTLRNAELVPVLVKSLQTALTRIEALEAAQGGNN